MSSPFKTSAVHEKASVETVGGAAIVCLASEDRSYLHVGVQLRSPWAEGGVGESSVVLSREQALLFANEIRRLALGLPAVEDGEASLWDHLQTTV